MSFLSAFLGRSSGVVVPWRLKAVYHLVICKIDMHQGRRQED